MQKYIVSIFILFSGVLGNHSIYSQKTIDSLRVSHAIAIGVQIGASTPLPVPARLSGFKWSPDFCPQLAWDITILKNEKKGLKTGLRIERKGMTAGAYAYQMYTQITIDDAKTKGYFTGYTETNIDILYLSIPLLYTRKFNDNWVANFGAYAAFKLTASFTGAVKNGYMRIDSPIGNRTNIDYEAFEFNDQIRVFDYGLMASCEKKLSKKLSAKAEISWGFSPVMKNSFRGLEYKLYNIYGLLGIIYQL